MYHINVRLCKCKLYRLLADSGWLRIDVLGAVRGTAFPTLYRVDGIAIGHSWLNVQYDGWEGRFERDSIRSAVLAGKLTATVVANGLGRENDLISFDEALYRRHQSNKETDVMEEKYPRQNVLTG